MKLLTADFADHVDFLQAETEQRETWTVICSLLFYFRDARENIAPMPGGEIPLSPFEEAGRGVALDGRAEGDLRAEGETSCC
ncbi:MAG TPA: hypothetical protein VLA12_11705 [Planctomycetaceae bacterium]|nr:hypothetical protein [Planctomycetaceae bacterium]